MIEVNIDVLLSFSVLSGLVWLFVLEGEAETASSSGSSSVGGSSGFQFRWWHLFFVILLIKIVAIAASGK